MKACALPVLPASQCVLNLNLGQFKKSMNFQWHLAGFGDLQLILIVFEGAFIGLCVGGWVVALEGVLVLAMAAGTT